MLSVFYVGIVVEVCLEFEDPLWEDDGTPRHSIVREMCNKCTGRCSYFTVRVSVVSPLRALNMLPLRGGPCRDETRKLTTELTVLPPECGQLLCDVVDCRVHFHCSRSNPRQHVTFSCLEALY